MENSNLTKQIIGCALADIHLAQVLTYLKLSSNRLGLLINFNVVLLKDGIKRVVNGY